MGLLDRLGLTEKEKALLMPEAVDPKTIPSTKMEKDLKRLREFEKRIKGKTQVNAISTERETQHDLALKLKNPFRGE